MNIGIIAEYNPFHYGHLYHLKKIKEMYPNSNIILVLSGPITERGDLSVYSKWDKTFVALQSNVDLVVELPIKYIQSADWFSKGAIGILNKLGCDTIVFGSESNDVELLKNLANIQLNNKEYDNVVKKYLDEGLNYPTAMSKALSMFSKTTINTPNDLLGLSYVKEIIKNNYDINPITIKRTNNYNSKKIEGKITSATSIRELLRNNKSIKKYIPKYSYEFIKNPIFLDDYFSYMKYKIITEDDLTKYQGIDNILQNRIKKFINDSNNLDELINNIKTKRYTYNRIKRALIIILFSLEKIEYTNMELEYIRVLGFSSKGKNILNKIKKTIDIPLLTTFDPKYLKLDFKINNILSLNKNIINKKEFIEKEFKQKPIIYEKK